MGPFKRLFLNIASRKLKQLLSGQLSRDMAAGVVRHVLTTLGGVLVAQGTIDETMATQLVGVGMTAFGLVWSLLDKTKTAR